MLALPMLSTLCCPYGNCTDGVSSGISISSCAGAKARGCSRRMFFLPMLSTLCCGIGLSNAYVIMEALEAAAIERIDKKWLVIAKKTAA